MCALSKQALWGSFWGRHLLFGRLRNPKLGCIRCDHRYGVQWIHWIHCDGLADNKESNNEAANKESNKEDRKDPCADMPLQRKHRGR